MHKGFLARLLGLGRHGLRAVNCSRSLCHSSSASPCQTASHVASPAPAEAPKQLPGPPHGRRYLPAAIGAQLPPQLLPAAATSVTDLQRQGCVSITVQCSPTAAGTQILVGMLCVPGLWAKFTVHCSEHHYIQSPEKQDGCLEGRTRSPGVCKGLHIVRAHAKVSKSRMSLLGVSQNAVRVHGRLRQAMPVSGAQHQAAMPYGDACTPTSSAVLLHAHLPVLPLCQPCT